MLDPTCTWTTNRDQIAVEALNRAPTERFETGGAIYQNEKGEFCYSVPVGNKSAANIEFKVPAQEGLQLAAIYHTHPAKNDEATNFSPHDVNVAEKLKLASYIKILRDGAIKKYEPGVTRAEKGAGEQGRMRGKMSMGDVIVAGR